MSIFYHPRQHREPHWSGGTCRTTSRVTLVYGRVSGAPRVFQDGLEDDLLRSRGGSALGSRITARSSEIAIPVSVGAPYLRRRQQKNRLTSGCWPARSRTDGQLPPDVPHCLETFQMKRFQSRRVGERTGELGSEGVWPWQLVQGLPARRSAMSRLPQASLWARPLASSTGTSTSRQATLTGSGWP